MSKVIVITGASSGIGLATANFLLEKGYIIHGIARNGEKVTDFKCHSGDVTNTKKIAEILAEIERTEGKIDAIINNAGMGISGAIEHTSEEDIKQIFDVNVLACINICKIAVPYLRKNGGGKIINIGSVAGEVPIPFQACYSATKSAISSFSTALGMEVKPFNIKVTTVLPGDTKTGFTGARKKNVTMEDENYADRIKKSIEKMEKDEQKGMSPTAVAKVIHKVLKKNNPPILKTVGFGYKVVVLLTRLLPRRLAAWVISKIYA